MSLLYTLADTVGITLRVTGDTVWGVKEMPMPVGPATVNLPVTVFSDLIHSREVGAFVKLSKALWMYLALRNSEQVLYVFDADSAGLTEKNAQKFGGVSVVSTLTKIKDSIRAVYVFKNTAWAKVDDKNLDKHLPN